MKKLICLIVMSIFLLNPTFSLAETKKLEFTLEEAIKVAVENSMQAKLDDFEIRTKEKQLKKIKEGGISGGYSLDSLLSIMEYQIKMKIKPKQTELELQKAKRQKQENLYALNIELLQQVSNIYISNKELEKETQKLNNLKELYRILQAKNKAGKIAEDETINLEWSINTKENNIKDLWGKLTAAYLAFKKLLNIPLDDSQISLNYSNQYKVFLITDVDEYVSKAQNKSFDVYNKQQKLQMEQDTLDITKVYFIAGQYEYDEQSLNLENAKYDLEESLKNIEVDVKNKYNNLLSQKDKVDLADEYSKLAEKKLKNTELKFKKGLLSKETLLSVQDNYLEAVFQREVAVGSYNMMKAELTNLNAE